MSAPPSIDVDRDAPFRPRGFAPGSWAIVLPALRAVLVAIFGGLTQTFHDYFDGEWWNSEAFCALRGGGDDAAIYTTLAPGSSVRRRSGSHVGVYLGWMRDNERTGAEAWDLLGRAGLLPPEDARRAFGDGPGAAAPTRFGEAAVFAALGVPVILRAEALARAAAGAERVVWRYAHRPGDKPWLAGVEGDALRAAGLDVTHDGDAAVLWLPPADVPPRRGARANPRMVDRPNPGALVEAAPCAAKEV